MPRDLNKMLSNNVHSEPEIVRGKGYILSTDTETPAAEKPTTSEKAPPVDRQSVRIRKDLLFRCEEQKLKRKKSGEPITLAEIIELAVEEWLEKEEKQ